MINSRDAEENSAAFVLLRDFCASATREFHTLLFPFIKILSCYYKKLLQKYLFLTDIKYNERYI